MSVQFVPPILIDCHSLEGVNLVCSGVTLVVGVLNEHRDVLGLLRVEDVPEVASVWNSALGKYIREVMSDLDIPFHHGPDCTDG